MRPSLVVFRSTKYPLLERMFSNIEARPNHLDRARLSLSIEVRKGCGMYEPEVSLQRHVRYFRGRRTMEMFSMGQDIHGSNGIDLGDVKQTWHGVDPRR